MKITKKYVSLLLYCILILSPTAVYGKGYAPSPKANSFYNFHSQYITPDDLDEVLMNFRYRGVGNVNVTGLYDYNLDKMFLPVIEIFSLLNIYFAPPPGDFTISGTYLTPENRFTISFTSGSIILNDRVFNYDNEEYRIGELDYYLSPLVFEEVFELFFEVNMRTLVLVLETDLVMPVEQRMERERSRRLIEAREVTREFYPLEYDRNRKFMGLGFVDYNITNNYSNNNFSTSYTLTGGAEFLGGDIQGNFNGFYSADRHTVRSNNLRWRYVVRDTPYFSSLSVGQLSSTGLQPRRILGASISNDPIEPRRIYESYIIDGNTDADSEVELYLNNRLIDFRRADELGYYRFEFPLTYGTSRVTINIYTPAGDVRTIDRQIQIPFTFLPQGELTYNIQGGILDLYPLDISNSHNIFNGDISYGITNWLTAKVGGEYNPYMISNEYLAYGSLSARLFSQYLANVDIVPDFYYRGILSVMYPAGRSFSLQYTHYDGTSIYNPINSNSDIFISFFTPFNLFNIPMGIRVGAEHRDFFENSITRLRGDLTMRLGRMNLRANYRDMVYNTGGEYSMGMGQLNTSLTYTFMRSPGLPLLVRGMFLRGNAVFNTTAGTLDQFDFQLTRSIRQSARLNIQAGYNTLTDMSFYRLGFIWDLPSMRTTTNVDYIAGNLSARQNIRGSLGIDQNPSKILPDNRNQVGLAGVSVILFVDNNNSGTFDEGDEIIPARAVRLDRSAQIRVARDGVVHISQLQSYFRYNMEVVRAALPNPMLVPRINNFSFVADPNQFKRIEIPFYQTGVIEGAVYIERNDRLIAQGGLRLVIAGVDNEFHEVIRNFSDGSYFAMDLVPGNYTIEVDQSQLTFLNAIMPEGPIEFEVRSLAEGDYIEGLDIMLVARVDTDTETEPIIERTVEIVDQDIEPKSRYIRITGFRSIYGAISAKANIERYLGVELFLFREESTRLFVLATEQFVAEKEDELITQFVEFGYPDAEIVSESAKVEDKLFFKLQIFASTTEYGAISVMQAASLHFDIDFTVEYDHLTELYSVRTLGYSSPLELLSLMEEIIRSGLYSDAFLLTYPRLQGIPVIFRERLPINN